MTPNQTFAALPADETRQLTSQTHPVLQDELPDGSDRSGVIAKELVESLILPAVSPDDPVIDPWMQGARYCLVDIFAEVFCSSDSLLSGAERCNVDVPCSTLTGMESTSPRR